MRKNITLCLALAFIPLLTFSQSKETKKRSNKELVKQL